MAGGGSGAGQPATIGEALAQRDRLLFVGRGHEVEVFDRWLTGPAEGPKLLSVIGPGGVGKTTLLRAFAHRCTTSGWEPTVVDGRVVDPSPHGLAAALGASTPEQAVELLGEERRVLLVDAFENLRPLTHFLLEEFLPALPSHVPVVIASRDDVTAGWRPWREVVQVLTVGGLAAPHAKELLRRRGVDDLAEVDRIVAVAKGHPLSLTVAADVVLRGGRRPLPDVPEWHVAVRSLVEDLLRHVEDPALRLLLEAAAILRQFDESVLAEMTPGDDISGAFARLCGLSIVRPGPRGLMLHDDIRGAIRDDLRWRNPGRYRTLRRRALDHYRRLGQQPATAEEAAWVLTEASYLSEDPFVHLGLFSGDDPSALWTEPARPADRQRLRQLRADFAEGLDRRRERPTAEELDPELLDALVGLPEARIRLAWNRDGTAEGYGLALPLVGPVLELLPADGAVVRLARQVLGVGPGAALVPAAGGADAWFLGTVVTVAHDAERVASVLTREVVRLFAEPRLLLACTADPSYQSVLQGFGFEPVAFEPPADAFPGLQGYALDLRLLGPELYLARVADGAALPRLPRLEQLEPELEAVLERWADPQALAASPLADLAGVLTAPTDDRAEAVRQLVAAALTAARRRNPADDQALRALELGYLQGTTKLESAARRLAVSRPTFYRMRKRAVRSLVGQLAAWMRAGTGPDQTR